MCGLYLSQQGLSQELLFFAPNWLSRCFSFGISTVNLHDTFLGINQIVMAKVEAMRTYFITDQGTNTNESYPFGIKNVGATNQRLVNKIFKPQISHNMEVYVMIYCSSYHDQWIISLTSKKLEHEVKPDKVCLWNYIEKFLSYMANSRCIEANLDKITTIIDI